MFSILFKLLKETEENDMLRSDSEASEHKSEDSARQVSLLSAISAKRNIIIRALLLAIYKSFSNVVDIQVISKLFFIMFLPYVFKEGESKNELLNYLDESEDTDDIERVLVKAIEIDNSRHRGKGQNLNLDDSKSYDVKDLSTVLLEELNILIGSDFIPLTLMINFIVKVAVLVIPEDLTVMNAEPFEMKDSPEKYLRFQISKNEYFEKIVVGLEGIKPSSIFSFILDFSNYNALYEILVLSVKLSFAGDELSEKGKCERIIHDLWSLMCHKHTCHIIYSFLLFMKYKLQNRISSLSYLDPKPQSANSELFARTDQILTLIFENEKFIETVNPHIIIERAMKPLNFLGSKLSLENWSIGKVRAIVRSVFERFGQELEGYFNSVQGITKVVDNVFESGIQEEVIDDRAFEYARDHQDLEESLEIEGVMVFFEIFGQNKAEVEYLNKHFTSVVESSLTYLDMIGQAFLDGSVDDKEHTMNIVIMVMICLYNYRHQYKMIEETTKGMSPGK